jgi:hypothetical protein
VTDAKGSYTWGNSKQELGGAPEGTKYRIKIEAQKDLIVLMKEEQPEEVEKILYKVPAGTKIARTVSEDGGEVFSFQLKTGEGPDDVEQKEVSVKKGRVARILTATPIPERYASYDDSDLECTVKAIPMFTADRQEYRYDFQL